MYYFQGSREHIPPPPLGGLKSVLASSKFCHLLITFANSFDPDQDRHSVGPDLETNCLKNSDSLFIKDFFEEKKLFFFKKKVSTQQETTKT